MGKGKEGGVKGNEGTGEEGGGEGRGGTDRLCLTTLSSLSSAKLLVYMCLLSSAELLVYMWGKTEQP